MKIRVLVVALVCCLGVLIAAPSARAQGSSGSGIVAKIPFEFNVGSKSFPTGEYRITRHAGSLPELQLHGADGKHNSGLTAVTRLARQHMDDAPKGSLVFDKVGDKHYLSEVWIPGQDGYLLKGTQEAHEHEIIDVKD